MGDSFDFVISIMIKCIQTFILIPLALLNDDNYLQQKVKLSEFLSCTDSSQCSLFGQQPSGAVQCVCVSPADHRSYRITEW